MVKFKLYYEKIYFKQINKLPCDKKYPEFVGKTRNQKFWERLV